MTTIPLELILIGFVATFLTTATVWLLWYVAEKIFANEVGQLQFFLTFIVLIIPFFILIYFGLDAIIDDAVATRGGLPTKLPILGVPEEIPLLAVVYIVITVLLGLRWRKLNLKKGNRDEARR